jgi:hypothetical protein
MPIHVGAGKDYMDVLSAFVWFFVNECLFVISEQDEQLRAQYHYLLTTHFMWFH